jgi:hypothetical protein
MGVQDRASISESDWKVCRRIRDLAQDRYAQRVLDEADRIRQDETLSFRDRYAELSRMVRERDKEMFRIFDTLRRSSAVRCLMLMRSHDLVTDEEVQSFSPEIQRASEIR